MTDFTSPLERIAAAGALVVPLAAARWLERRFAVSESAAPRMLAAVILYAALVSGGLHILAALEIAGAIGPLVPSRILLIESLLAAGAWILTRGRGVPFVLRPLPEWRPFMPALVFLGGCYALLAIKLATSYPTGSDGVAYHLPLAVRWLQTGSLAIQPLAPWQFSLPANGEIPMMLLMATGIEPLATLFNAVMAAVAAVSVWLLARRLGADQAGAFVAALVALSIPMVMFQTVEAFIDLYATGFFLAALALFLVTDRSPRALVHVALAAGLAAGAKPVYWVWSGSLMTAVLVQVWRGRTGASSRAGAAAALAVLAPLLFWFARAAHATGNPFYPLRVEIAGYAFEPGIAPSEITDPDHDLKFVRSRAAWPLYPWTEYMSRGYNYGPDSGLGAAFAALVLPALCWRLLGWARGDPVDRLTRHLTLAAAGGAIVWWFVMQRVPRFALPLPLVAIALAAPVFTELWRDHRLWFRRLAIASIFVTSVIAGLAPIQALGGRIRTGEWSRAAFYGLPDLVDHLPAGSRVLGTHMFFTHGMAGPRLDLRFLAAFEAPAPWTAAELRALGVDYVIEDAPSPAVEAALAELGAEILFDRAREPLLSPRILVARVWRLSR